jgi:hypothetical protein
MKKLFRSITVVLLLFVSISQAQGLSVGPNIALNISTLG